MTVVVPAYIAHAIAESQERYRLAFMAMSDEEKAAVIAKVEAEIDRRLLEGSGDGCVGLCGEGN